MAKARGLLQEGNDHRWLQSVTGKVKAASEHEDLVTTDEYLEGQGGFGQKLL